MSPTLINYIPSTPWLPSHWPLDTLRRRNLSSLKCRGQQDWRSGKFSLLCAWWIGRFSLPESFPNQTRRIAPRGYHSHFSPRSSFSTSRLSCLPTRCLAR